MVLASLVNHPFLILRGYAFVIHCRTAPEPVRRGRPPKNKEKEEKEKEKEKEKTSTKKEPKEREGEKKRTKEKEKDAKEKGKDPQKGAKKFVSDLY